jgi:hypothetical protein
MVDVGTWENFGYGFTPQDSFGLKLLILLALLVVVVFCRNFFMKFQKTSPINHDNLMHMTIIRCICLVLVVSSESKDIDELHFIVGND